MNKIIYLDAAATYQKPDCVIASELDFLQNSYANAARGFCQRVADVDDMMVRTRARVAAFMNARPDQIVFTSGTTAAMNMVADMLAVNATTRLLVSDLDHHSARLPFEKKVLSRAGRVFVCELGDDMNFDVAKIPVADVFVITAMSNVLGQAQNVAEIVQAARQKNPNVITVVDAAQYVVHNKIDVRAWDCDFVAWSAHKIGADTGLGVLYIKNPERVNPHFIGGGMVQRVMPDGQIVLAAGAERFEAGTQPLTQIAGLIPAIDSLEQRRPDMALIQYLYDELSGGPKIKLLTRRDASVVTFVVDGMNVVDMAARMGVRGLCARAGAMCASWMMNLLNIDGAIRLSVGAYNSKEDIDAAIKIIKDCIK